MLVSIRFLFHAYFIYEIKNRGFCFNLLLKKNVYSYFYVILSSLKKKFKINANEKKMMQVLNKNVYVNFCLKINFNHLN